MKAQKFVEYNFIVTTEPIFNLAYYDHSGRGDNFPMPVVEITTA